jgi:hypothetical protein
VSEQVKSHARRTSLRVQVFITTTARSVDFDRGFHRSDFGDVVKMMNRFVSSMRLGGTPSCESASTKAHRNGAKQLASILSTSLKYTRSLANKKHQRLRNKRNGFCSPRRRRTAYITQYVFPSYKGLLGAQEATEETTSHPLLVAQL